MQFMPYHKQRRWTVGVPETIAKRAEEAAKKAGVSISRWVARLIERASSDKGDTCPTCEQFMDILSGKRNNVPKREGGEEDSAGSGERES